MTTNNKCNVAIVLLTLSFTAAMPSCQALDTWEFKTGKGESVIVKKGLFGTKAIRVHDRLGNSYESDKSFFGKKKDAVSFFGNGMLVEKDFLGRKSYNGGTILGDKVHSKRSWFGLGPRRTSIDISGTMNLAEQLLTNKKAPAPVLPVTNSGTYSDIGLRTGMDDQKSGIQGGASNLVPGVN